MSKEPINMEDLEGGTPSGIQGREVNPDVDETTQPNTEVVADDAHMADILSHVPDDLKERVSKLQREELSMPGNPRDREAYEAYLGAEKMIRDIARRKTKKEFNWKGLPAQEG